MMTKIEIARIVQREQVDMCVGNVDAHHGLSDLDARTGFLESLGDALGKEMEFTEELIIDVEDIVDFFLGDAKHMAAHDGVDVEEGEAVLSLGHFVAGDFSGHDTRKDCCH